jgi:hypothetical protein
MQAHPMAAVASGALIAELERSVGASPGRTVRMPHGLAGLPSDTDFADAPIAEAD